MTTAYRGTVWPGGAAAPFAGVVAVGDDGTVGYAGPDDGRAAFGLTVDGGWIGPALVDAHVHLAFGTFEEMRDGGVVAVRDLGAPPDRAQAWRGADVAVAGPLLTAPGGYPSRSWGADGFGRFVATPDEARAAVRALAPDVDLVKVALEPAGGQPVPGLDVVRAITDEAHAHGLAVTAHALSEPMVLRALDGGVDELCHTPAEPLSERAVERVAAAGVPVVSTIETLGGAAPANAAALHAAGVRLVYGTDLGNAGTRPGADARELRRLADAGLGWWGALRAATEGAAAAFGLAGRHTGRIEEGEQARLVLLDADPVADPGAWERPFTVICGREVMSGHGRT